MTAAICSFKTRQIASLGNHSGLVSGKAPLRNDQPRSLLKSTVYSLMMETASGFREHDHTADWELEVWAPDLPSLLEQSARGMYALSGVKLEQDARQSRRLHLQAQDAESLLVRFLSELLWLEQEEGLGFSQISIQLDEQLNLQAELVGSPILSLDKEIKAVTYHNLEVVRSPEGYCVNIVFDV